MAKSVDIYVRRGAAYVQLDQDFMLCIGTKSEVQHASPQKIARLIEEALAFNWFSQIENGIGHTKH